ncbi:hypothetical protein L596_017277 [Steinernema carpocapsae]|uniref:Uncharacterized protein n=1 Tax=Steinernema carpocapsae TaxID=34508 RepID=A0A4U5N1D7_STECR|nr:hypothetical protein L596_017277 [Steinernema carpocapsae]
MDLLPIEFYEDLLSSYFNYTFSQSYLDLSGTFGHCAEEFKKKGSRKCVNIKNGAIDAIDYYDIFWKPKQPESVVQASQFRLNKVVKFYGRENSNSAIDEKLKKQLKKFLLERGMLCLVLESTKLNQAWIELFSSWRSLNFVFIDALNDSVYTLLQKLLDQEQLHYLYLHCAIPSSKETNLICEFLEQPQLLNVVFTKTYQEEVKSAVISRWKENMEQFAGKFVEWHGFQKLHDGSFRGLKRRCASFVQYQKENLIVEYLNADATDETTEEEFMKNVTRSGLFFA